MQRVRKIHMRSILLSIRVSDDMSDERCEGEEDMNDQQCDNSCEHDD